ncbi:MAG: TetR/AcrR family transcriptional regulator [Saprospiraceae bacterium]
MDETRRKILSVADRYFRRYGLKSVSMDDLAREIGISKKTLYQHVSSKEELIREMMLFQTEQEMAIGEATFKSSENAVVEFIQLSSFAIDQLKEVSPTTMYDLQKYYRPIWEETIQANMVEHRRGVMRNIERGQAEGLFRPEADASFLAHLFSYCILGLCEGNVLPFDDKTVGKYLQQLAFYHLHGLITPAGARVLDNYMDQKQAEQ